MEDEKKTVQSRSDNNEKNNSGADKAPDSNKIAKDKGKGIRFGGALLVCAAIFLVAYLIVNTDSISAVISKFTGVITPVLLGFAIAYILNPILRFFEFKVFNFIPNKKICRGLSLTLTYLLSIGFIIAVALLIIPAATTSILNITNNLESSVNDTITLINNLISDYFGTHPLPEGVTQEEILATVSKLLNESGDMFDTITKYAMQYGKGLVIGVKNVILAAFISLYVLVSKERLTAQSNKICTAFLSENAKRKFYKYVRICDKTFGGFLIGKIIDSLIIGVITFLTLLFFNIAKIEDIILISVIVCVTNIIPVFGPFIGAIPSFFILFLQSPPKAFLFLLLILVIQQLDGNVIGPKILGNATGMSTLGVMIAIIIMGDYFGVVGMILGVPIFSVAITLINEISESKLKKKNLPLNSAEYYPEDSLVDPNEPSLPIMRRFYMWLGHMFVRIWRLAFGKITHKKHKKINTENDTTIEKDKDTTNEQ